jgi:hypothetical protein
MAKKGSFTKALISIIFIALGIGSVILALQNLLEFDLAGVLGCLLGVLMFMLGILGLFKGSMKACRTIAVIVCILSAASFIMTVIGGSLAGLTTTLVWALLAWVYFDLT